MMTTKQTSECRQLAIYLGVDIPVDSPDGECDLDEFAVCAYYGDGPGERDPEDAERSARAQNAVIDFARKPAHYAERGSALQRISAALRPRRDEFGRVSDAGDGRDGRQYAIEQIVLAWPLLPQVEHVEYALSETHYIEQGRNWRRIVVDGRTVYAAIASGESAADIRAAIQAGDERYGRIESAQ